MEFELEGRLLPISQSGELGVPSYTIWAPGERMDGLIDILHRGTGPGGLIELSDEMVEISFSKGCYLGQEVIARVHYRGQVARRVSRLELTVGGPPEPGVVVWLEGRRAGEITSAVWSAVADRVVALAMLQRRAIQPGTVLRLEGGGSALVV